MLIDSNYFRGDLEIPNQDASGYAGTAIKSALNASIERFERELLLNLLGKTLYTEFVAGLAANPVEGKWTNLKSQLIDSENLLSPLAYYVFYKFRRQQLSVNMNGVEAVLQSENASNTSPNFKLTEVWNECRKGILDVIEFLNGSSDYPNWNLMIVTGNETYDSLISVDEPFYLTRMNVFGI